MDFDLRLLRHCRALAEEGSFAKASRVLHITQPALSRSIRDLEERVGFGLFDRSGSRIVPTDLGRAFVDRARDLLAHAEALDRDVALLKGNERGALAVGAATYVSAMFMGPALASFAAAHPGVDLRVANDHWANLLDMLHRRELDLVVSHLPTTADAADLAVTRLHERTGSFVVRPGHPLLDLPAPTIADVAAYPIACSARVGAVIAEALRKGRSEGGRRSPGDFTCESFPLLKEVVKRSNHVLMTTLTLVGDDLVRGELARVSTVDAPIKSSFAVMQLASRTLAPVAARLVEAIVAADDADFAREQKLQAKWLQARPAAGAADRPARRKATVPG
jgi:DNA-binding transcriptional LysR family regulator